MTETLQSKPGRVVSAQQDIASKFETSNVAKAVTTSRQQRVLASSSSRTSAAVHYMQVVEE